MKRKIVVAFILVVSLLLICTVQALPTNFTDWASYGDAWRANNDTYTIVMWNATGARSPWVATGNATTVQLLSVGGGGSGAGSGVSGGGGAGGLIYNVSKPVSGSYSISIGSGGVSTANAHGADGSNTIFGDTTANGGGGGSYSTAASPGGSGGGAWIYSIIGGASNQPTTGVSTGYGNKGGDAVEATARSGGGGGASSAGATGSSDSFGGNGGNGMSISITGTSTVYAAGGGGSAAFGSYTGGTGGSSSIGGDGSPGNADATKPNGNPNTGSGGGAGWYDPGGPTWHAGGNGGSGIVIISYANTVAPTSSFSSNVTSGVSPLVVEFTDTTTNNPASWQWGFKNVTGNNSWVSFATTQNPIYTFGGGNFSINLTTSNSGGSNTSTQVTFINVSSGILPPLVANFVANVTTGYPGDYFQFTDTSDGSPTLWDYGFGDGTANSSLQNPIHQYTSAGSYDVFLNASNATASSYITKENYIVISSVPIPPPPTFIANRTYSTNKTSLPVLFTITSAAPVHLLAYNMSFGDGDWANYSASAYSQITHTYTTIGTFSPTLYVLNDAGSASTTMTDMIVVSLPFVSLLPSPKSINIGIPDNVSVSAGNISHAANVLLNVTFNKSALQVIDVYPETGWSLTTGISNTNGFVTINLSHTDYSTTPADTLANIKFNVTTNGLGNATEPLNIVSNKGIIPTSSYTDGLYDFYTETPGSITPTNLTFTQTFLFVRSDTGDPINFVQITNMIDGVVSGTFYTTTGSQDITSTWGTVNISSSANNFYASTLYFVPITGGTTTVSMQPITGGLNTNVVYQAQLYNIHFQNLIGTPLGGLTVTIAPLNFTMPSNWQQRLMGISPSVNLQGNTLTGITGTTGTLGVPLAAPLGYLINVSGTAYSGDVVNYSIVEYPPSQGGDILITLPTSITEYTSVTPTPAFITYNIYNESVTNTTQILSVNFNDPTGAANLTIVTVTNQSGYILNTTTYTGASATNVVNNFTYVQGVTSPNGDIINYGFSSYVTTAGGWNNISDTYDTNGGTSLTGSATYDQWAAIIIIVLVSSAFTASTVYIGTIGVGLMGLLFYYTVKWFTPGVQGSIFVVACVFWICIGIIGFIAKKGRGGF